MDTYLFRSIYLEKKRNNNKDQEVILCNFFRC